MTSGTLKITVKEWLLDPQRTSRFHILFDETKRRFGLYYMNASEFGRRTRTVDWNYSFRNVEASAVLDGCNAFLVAYPEYATLCSFNVHVRNPNS